MDLLASLPHLVSWVIFLPAVGALAATHGGRPAVVSEATVAPRRWWPARAAFVASAALFTLLTRYVYVDVLAAARVFDYMGVRANEVAWTAWLPFFVLAVTLVLQDVLGRPRDSALRRQVGLGVVSLYLAVVAMTFVFFYPVLTGHPLSHAEWLQRMWFPSWF